jgi:hypothetical protein
VLIIWSALNVAELIPTVVLPAKDSVLKVFVPVIVVAVADPLVKLTLLNVSPTEEMLGVVPVKLI